jgi:hypothetical protein
LRAYTTNRKVAGSLSDEVIEFLSVYLIFPPALAPASNRKEYQMKKNM